MSLAIDCLLGVTGLVPDGVTERERMAAITMPETFAKRARSWWLADEREPYKELPEKNLDKLFDSVAIDPTLDEITAWLKDAGDDMEIAEDLHLALVAARKYLVQKWPRVVIPTFGGDRVMPLAIDDAAEVTSLWAVLDDPVRVLDEMDSGTLSPSQAEAFRTVYPALYDHYRDALEDAAALRVRKDPDWMPSEQQEIALAILTAQPSGVAPYEATTPPGEPPQQKKDLGAKDAETQLDKSAKPKGPK